jgi:hypothetical protein
VSGRTFGAKTKYVAGGWKTAFLGGGGNAQSVRLKLIAERPLKTCPVRTMLLSALQNVCLYSNKPRTEGQPVKKSLSTLEQAIERYGHTHYSNGTEAHYPSAWETITNASDRVATVIGHRINTQACTTLVGKPQRKKPVRRGRLR